MSPLVSDHVPNITVSTDKITISETVGIDISSYELYEEDDMYDNFNKAELKKKCLERNLPTSGTARWYCHDCSEHICNMCKETHEKLKIARTHVITPHGTLLVCNIGKDLTMAVN